MEISRIGIHESTSIDFPFEAIEDALADLDAELRSVANDPEELAACDAVVTFTHQPEILEAAPAWVHTTQAGVDGFPLDEYADADVMFTNSSGLHGESVGETTVGLMLALARRLHVFIKNQRDCRWEFPAWDDAFTLADSSVCIVGLGTVGRGVAKRAAGLDMTVTGVRRNPDPVPGVETVYPAEDLLAAVEDAKFVVLAVPLTDETRGLVGPDELAAMRDDAYLINVARGAVVDEPALVEVLQDDSLAGAALDVFETEPLPDDSPLWHLDDVIVTPHAAVADRAFYERVADLLRANFDRITGEDELENRVV